MSIKEKDLDEDFIPLVNPPVKEGKNKTYCFAFKDRKLLLLDENGIFGIPDRDQLSDMRTDIIRQQYLGELGDISCFSMEINCPEEKSKKDSFFFAELRNLPDLLEYPLPFIAGKAVHIMEWDRNTQFCGRCGAATSLKKDERAKQCKECGYTVFPKISPAVIVMIEKDSRLLLARSPGFKPGMYSIIAGFVEPGETIEQAVVREIREEVGISVKNIRYFGSQPWPYPDSLMIGFTAEYMDGEIKVDGIEIEEAAWFAADEIPNVPGTDSISGQLISYFISKHS